MDGLRAAAELLDASPGTQVVMLTAAGGRQLAAQATAVGVVAVVPKSGSLTDLLYAIRGAFAHGRSFDTAPANKAVAGPGHRAVQRSGTRATPDLTV